MGYRNRIKKSQNFTSFFFVIAFLLAATLVFVILDKVWGDIRDPLEDGLNSAMPNDSPVNLTITMDQTSGVTTTFDKLMPLLIIGLFAFVLIVAGGFMQHPIMIFVGVIVLAVALLLAVVYANLYNSITESDGFADSKDNMGVQDIFMQYLPTIIFVMAIGIGAAIIWSKKSGGASGY